jgi:hypothetical protein
MNKWYLEVRKLIREIYKKAIDAREALQKKEESSAETIKRYLIDDYRRLQVLWNERIDGQVPSYLGRHIGFGMVNDYDDILYQDLPSVEERLDKYLAEATEKKGEGGFEYLLHRAVVASSLEHFKNGHYREAVLNSITAIFDLIRDRTSLDLDGSALVNRALSLADPTSSSVNLILTQVRMTKRDLFSCSVGAIRAYAIRKLTR